ncbi:MAG: 4Fe-4S ferredoxin [Synechococcaceae cyanobacterium SM2_3_1]|nr:4Fe-4S ferredoxin [Synechococcaceae cyanobacterium SM2_3_1]
MITPSESLQNRSWFKLICGASFHHLPSVQNLTLIYTLAGADCIDLAADPANVRAAVQGIEMALEHDPRITRPWLMVSFNDGEDPHFRKAQLSQLGCPADCPQPCLAVCPPHAIAPGGGAAIRIEDPLCYGCGRCQPVCPHERLEMWSYQVQVQEVMPELMQTGIQAIEIHTRVGRLAEFTSLWSQLQTWIPDLEAISISFNDHPYLQDYLKSLVACLQPFPRHLIWQADGRPMSGDIGAGTTQKTLHLAKKVLAMHLPGHVQLAGGTNQATIPLVGSDLEIAGVAYGSFARQLVAAAVENGALIESSEALQLAWRQASQLVGQVKSRSSPAQPVQLPA